VANLAAANCYKKDHFDSPAIQDVVSKVEYIYITVRLNHTHAQQPPSGAHLISQPPL
jgi:hypothetical protein